MILPLIAMEPGAARADVGVRVGPRGGVAISDDVDPFFGLDLRLTVPTSPITFQPTFDCVLDEEQTLYHIGGNLLYEVPVSIRLKPYLGIGFNFSSFALRDPTPNSGVDDRGNRLGMNVLAGARLDLPWVSPFAQVTKSVGEFDAVTIGGGLALTLREHGEKSSTREPMRLAATPYIASNIAGDVQSGRIGLGLSLGYYPLEYFGIELDSEMHGHFFRDEDVADLAPEGVDINTNAVLVSASAVGRYCWMNPSVGGWCPFAMVGAGAIHAWFSGRALMPGAASFSKSQTDPALIAGLGITHLFTRHVGFRVDARYFRAIVADDAPDGGYFEDYGLLRVSAGVSLGFP